MSKDHNHRKSRRKSSGMRIQDLAHEAGVSPATVSRTFNNPEKVSAATREIVETVAKRHHFVAHGLATGLVSRRSGLDRKSVV